MDQNGFETGNASDPGTLPHEPNGRKQTRAKDANIRQGDVSLDLHDPVRSAPTIDANTRTLGETHMGESDDVSSKWIHRDKLARIENEELQAAGIILPRPRGRSKPRRNASQEKAPSYPKSTSERDPSTEPRSRKNSAYSDSKPADTPFSGWDLRLPDEIAEESYFSTAHGSRGSSRIPVAKQSPVPIALEHIERDTPIARRRDDSPAVEESIAFPKMRARSASVRLEDAGIGEKSAVVPLRIMSKSASDISPHKAANPSHSAGGAITGPGSRKPSVQSKSASTPSKSAYTTGHPKTRNGVNKDFQSGGTGATRPSTRSGEKELSRETSAGAASKQPEGEPPWMISAYRPDPRLPPDQQLLPTVARRLQQEKWEREGKFGNVYDRDFRPLTDEGYLTPPEPTEKPAVPKLSGDQLPEKQDEWPLKPDAKASASQPGRAGSYSTIPKIQEKPNISPLPSPRGPISQPADGDTSQPTPQSQDAVAEAKDGCGCCNIM